VKCSVCGFEIHPTDGVDHLGISVRHTNRDRCVDLLRAAHDKRVTQLLEANNTELERRRIAEGQYRTGLTLVHHAIDVIEKQQAEIAALRSQLEVRKHVS
jgi:hypothetical protein